MTVEHIRNIASFAVGILTAYNLWQYRIDHNVDHLMHITYTALAHLSIDIASRRPTNFFEITMIIHHIFGIMLAVYTALYVDLEYFSNVAVTIGAVEISSIFLVGRIWLADAYKKHEWNWILHLQSINNMLFVASFAYFRIYLYSANIIFSDEYNTKIREYLVHDIISYYLFNASIYGLYALNIYWFAIILKSLCKRVKKLSYVNCEWALQYTYTTSLIYVIYKYDHPVYYWDILGYALLSSSSYLYHGSLYRKLMVSYPNVDIDLSEVTPVYLFDIACINVRTWLVIGLPILYDVLIMVMNNYANLYVCISLLLTIFIGGLILFIKPFYQMNHLALHILLFWMSVALTNNNIPI